jgi:hypothetical protein
MSSASSSTSISGGSQSQWQPQQHAEPSWRVKNSLATVPIYVYRVAPESRNSNIPEYECIKMTLSTYSYVWVPTPEMCIVIIRPLSMGCPVCSAWLANFSRSNT